MTATVTPGYSSTLVNGVTTGTTNIYFRETNAFGCSAVAEFQVTVNSLPSVPAIAGSTNACLGLTSQLSDVTAGGVWSTDDAGIAAISPTGFVSGVSIGSTIISYTVTDGFGCVNSTNTLVTVNPLPVAITGMATICAGGTVALNDADGTGTWSSSNSNASVDVSGLVAGVSAGSAVISYTIPTGCYATATINITPAPTASPVNDGPICFGGTVILTSNGAGGTTIYNWSGAALSSTTSANPSAVPTVTSTYSLTVTDGTTNSGCSSSYTTSVIVNSFGISAANNGPSCVGGTVNLTGVSTGVVPATNYSWSGPSGYNSTLQNPVLSGVTTATTGTYTLHATAGSGCAATSATFVTINTLGVTASVSSPVCVGGTINLSSIASGTASPVNYSWSGPIGYTSANRNSVLAPATTDMEGAYTITVTAPGSGCVARYTGSTAVNTIGITAANDGPACQGSAVHFTSTPSGTATPSGYAWSGPVSLPGMQNPSLTSASTSMSGTYSVTVTASGSGCSATATTSLAVTAFGVVAGNSGPVCAGNTLNLTASTIGAAAATYSWNGPAGYTSTDQNPVISGAAIGGIYTVIALTGAGCAASSTTAVSVIALPSPVSGAANLCVGSTTTLSDITTGGTWSSSNPGVASISTGAGTTRSLIAAAAGTATISYVVTGGCASTLTVTVNAAAVITGMAPVCIGATVALSTDISGGTWSSTNTSHAVVDGSGVVTGVGNGTSNIVYTLPSGCSSISVVTVNAIPSSIAGVAKTCTGQFTALNNVGGGGIWSSSNPAVGTINTTTGLFVNVTGVTAGTTTISYTSGGGCPAILVVTVNPISPVLGMTPICVGTAVLLSDATADGAWTSSNSRATVDGSGNVTGVSTGTAIISYTTAAGCVATAIATVQATPTVIIGLPRVCVGSSATLSEGSTGGTWSSSNSNASVDGSGTITGGSVGTATISYTFSNGCAATKIATVNDVPSVPTGTTDLCAGASTIFTDAASGGTWAVTPVTIATINATTGLLTAITSGTATVVYSTGPGCIATTIVTVEAIAPISGNTSVCVGGSSDLGNATSGGTWSSADATITIDGTTGNVTGVSVGTATVTYTIPSGCSRTATITINPPPTPITGTFVVCPGVTTALSDIGSGSWSSGNTFVATVSAATGIVTGVTGGTANITYTAGIACIAVAQVTVNPAPSGIGGPAAVCIGSVITENDFTPGGTWSTISTNISIDGSGNVSGITAGSASITYMLTSTGCFTTRTINVNALPAPISGNTTLCVGGVSFLTDATSGGTTWTSSNTSVATVSASGAVTAVSTGTANITYVAGTGCTISTSVTVTSMPSAITGNAPVCPGGSFTLTDASGPGTWSSSNAAIASVGSATGLVTGVASGMAMITYSAFGAGCIATVVTTVSPLTAIYGTLSVCPGATSVLHNTTTGGTWSSTSASVSVGAATGVVTAITSGTATITYTLPTGCSATTIFTVNDLPATLTGNTPLCTGTSITLGETVSGGTWSSSNTRATVSPSGNVTAVTAGTAIISYVLPTGCLTTAILTMNATPASITGVTSLCIGLTSGLSDATVGGTWTSSTSAASVGSTGVVTGLSSGTSIISYTLSSGCGVATNVTVTSAPNDISGTLALCVGSTTSLSDLTGGGTWVSSNLAVGTIGSATGVVSGLASGTTTISYRIGTGCFATAIATVSAAPSAISGVGSVCSGFTTSLSDATTGGTWSSSDASIASVGSTGIVLGAGVSGTATISYIVGIAGCSSLKTITVNPSPAAVGGTPAACVGTTSALTDASAGGVWSSSATTIATVVGSSGVVTGVAAGTARISYNASGCSAITVFTVNALPSSIGGSATVCQNASVTLSNTTAGGTWTSTSAANIVGEGTIATVTGITAGTAIVSYVLPTGCYKTYTETIKPLPTPILGNTVVCGIGSVTFLSDATAGTSWVISPVGTATISASGRVYGVSFGTATVTYTGSNGCTINTVVTVNSLPSVAPISGASTVAHLATITLSDVTGSGVWSSTSPAIGSIGSVSGIVTGVASAGTTTISYTVTDAFGCKNAATKVVTVTATAPHSGGTIVSGTATILTGTSVTAADELLNGTWSSSNTAVATVDDGGMVNGIAPGIADITHTVSNSNGEISTTVIPFVVSSLPVDISVVPNPNAGIFTVKGTLGNTQDQEVELEVTDVLGQIIYKSRITALGGKISEQITISNTLANGMYILNMHTAGEQKAFHFVMEK